MKSILSVYKNWRTWALCLIEGLALCLICCDSSIFLAFIASKIIGFALALASIALFRHWERSGKLKELIELLDDEEEEETWRVR